MSVRRILLILLLLAVLGAAGEILVRSVPSLLPAQRQVRLQAVLSKDQVAPDPEIGFVRAPGFRELVKTLDYTYLRETDEHGFPNVGEWPSRADVVILGDSLVMGEGTGVEAGFVQRFARAVSARTVNLGVAGAGPDRQLLIYRKFGQPLHPRLVMSFLFLAADITNDEHFRAWKTQAPQADYNRFRLSYAGRQDHRSTFNPGRLLARSRLLDVLRDLLHSDGGETTARAGDGSEVYLDPQTSSFLARNPGDQSRQLSHFVESVSGIRESVKQENAEFVVVLIPSKEEVLAHVTVLPKEVRKRLEARGLTLVDLQGPARAGCPHA